MNFSCRIKLKREIMGDSIVVEEGAEDEMPNNGEDLYELTVRIYYSPLLVSLSLTLRDSRWCGMSITLLSVNPPSEGTW